MNQPDILLEVHYFSGGIKTLLIGSDGRPSWIPSSDLIGLHNDVYPKPDEFVIEVSRMRINEDYVTWIGMFSYAPDEIYGDRANYGGIGVWLRNKIPVDATHIVDALFKLCKIIIRGEAQSSIDSCKRLIEDDRYLNSWVMDISAFPDAESGIRFSSDRSPNTLNIRASNKDLDTELERVSQSILLNSITADGSYKTASRILYILLSEESPSPRGNQEYLTVKPHIAISQFLNYFQDSIEKIKKENVKLNDVLHHRNAELKQSRTDLENLEKVKKENVRLNDVLNNRNAELIQLRTDLENAVEINRNSDIINRQLKVQVSSLIVDSQRFKALIKSNSHETLSSELKRLSSDMENSSARRLLESLLSRQPPATPRGIEPQDILHRIDGFESNIKAILSKVNLDSGPKVVSLAGNISKISEELNTLRKPFLLSVASILFCFLILISLSIWNLVISMKHPDSAPHSGATPVTENSQTQGVSEDIGSNRTERPTTPILQPLPQPISPNSSNELNKQNENKGAEVKKKGGAIIKH